MIERRIRKRGIFMSLPFTDWSLEELCNEYWHVSKSAEEMRNFNVSCMGSYLEKREEIHDEICKRLNISKELSYKVTAKIDYEPPNNWVSMMNELKELAQQFRRS